MKRNCKNTVKFKASVSNGWTKEFETKCGWFADGEKRYCNKCNKLTKQK